MAWPPRGTSARSSTSAGRLDSATETCDGGQKSHQGNFVRLRPLLVIGGGCTGTKRQDEEAASEKNKDCTNVLARANLGPSPSPSTPQTVTAGAMSHASWITSVVCSHEGDTGTRAHHTVKRRRHARAFVSNPEREENSSLSRTARKERRVQATMGIEETQSWRKRDLLHCRSVQRELQPWRSPGACVLPEGWIYNKKHA